MPHAPDLTGAALDGRYELHGLIGEGTFGRVYRGRDRRLARPVAVKVIKPWWAEDPEWVRSFEREAQLLASISDPGIVQIYDVGSAPEGIYYVAELVDGESLVERLRRYGALSPDHAADLAEQLARALSRAHAQRVVHRDVKPANVLISTDGRVKVADFGVARLAEGSTDGGVGTVVGTPRYMAPEQARGLPATPATDVYGVGVVLYEMLAGRAPFEGSSAVELAFRHVHEPPPPLPAGLPEPLARIVGRALAKEPAERYADGASMAAALSRSRAEIAEEFAASDVRVRRGTSTRGSVALLELPAPHAPHESIPPDLAPPDLPPIAAGVEPGRIPKTRVAAPYSPRRNINPSGRRRRIALLGFVVLLALGMVVAGTALAPGHVRVPNLHGLSRGRARAIARHDGLHPSFTHRYSDARPGTVIAQSPRARVRVTDGTTVALTLSAGPAPIAVPSLVGESTDAATTRLDQVKLHPSVKQVPAPGVSTGQIVRQSPHAGAKLRPGSTVVLSAAEAPQWRGPLAGFAGQAAGSSVPFRIQGAHWRMVYDMHYLATCALIFICSGPSATVRNVNTGSVIQHFDLDEGDTRIWTFSAPPGVYQVSITPGADSARWSAHVQDYF